MNIDEQTDIVLNQYLNKKTQHIFAVLRKSLPKLDSYEEEKFLIDYMVEKGLIKKANFDEGGMDYTITTEGYEILTFGGGWLKHLEGELLRHVEKRVEVNEARQAERNRFKISTGVSIAAVLVSSISIIFDVSQSEKVNTIEKIQEQQERKLDSLSRVTTFQDDLLKTKATQSNSDSTARP